MPAGEVDELVPPFGDGGPLAVPVPRCTCANPETSWPGLKCDDDGGIAPAAAAAPGSQVGEVGLVKPGWGAGDEPGGRSGANADQSIARAALSYRSRPSARRERVLDASS